MDMRNPDAAGGSSPAPALPGLADPVSKGTTFGQILQWELKRGARYQRTFTLLRVGVDPETGSSQARGAVDEHVGGVMREVLRDTDLVCRLEAGEFAVLLPETGGGFISPVFQRLMDALNAQAGAAGWPVTFSVGAVTWRMAEVSASELMDRAEELLIHARRDSVRVVQHEVLV